jgi:multidrug efflux pump subunit AcrB/outer membrane protein TolC
MNFGVALNSQKRLTLAASVLLILAGVLTWSVMPKQEDPSLPDRFGSVVVAFPGARAETVEELIVIPLEKELRSVADIRNIGATARADVAIFSIELNETVYETDAAWKRVEDALARGEKELPPGAEPPETSWEGIELQAVTLAITGSGDWLELRDAAEIVEAGLYRIPGVKRVDTTPELDAQVTVALPEAALRQIELSTSDLATIVGSRTRAIPGGHIELGGLRVPLDTGSDIRSIDELAMTQIPTSAGASLPLAAVAEIRYGREEPIANLVRFNGHQAIIVGAVPKDSIDVVAFGREVERVLPQIEAGIAPLDLEVMTFQPRRVEDRIGGLQHSLLQGMLVVALVLVLSMGLRLGLVVAAILPTVALASLTIFGSFGGVLEQMSVAALVMSLGLLVDNAIVVSERIQWRIDSGEAKLEAVDRAIREMAVPLAAATGTTLAAFLPLLLSRGATADFTSSIPRLVMLTIGVSLLFALTVTPTLGIVFFKPSPRSREHRLVVFARRISHIPAQRPRLVVSAAALAVFCAFALAPFVGAQFFPSGDRNQLVLDIELPEGTHLLATNDAAIRLENAIAERSEVVQVGTFVGRSAPAFYYNIIPQSNAPHFAQLLVTTRKVSDVDALVDWSRSWAKKELPGVILVPRRLEQGPPVSAPIEIRLLSDDLSVLQEATLRTLGAVQDAPGTVDVYHDLSLGSLNLSYRIDDAAAGQSRLGRPDVAVALLGVTRGLSAGEIQQGSRAVPVVVRSPEGEFTPVSSLESTAVWTPDGRILPVSALGRSEAELRPAAIRRRNGVRTASVYAQLSGGTAYNEVLASVVPNIALPPGASFQVGGAAEGSGEANQAIGGAAYVGVAVLLFILIAQFRSFRKVGIVLVTIPLSAVGIIPGLLIGGQEFGFMSMLGVIALIGIVVNNAIILIDVIDSRLRDGVALADAVNDAVVERTRPIVLTAVTTIAGLVPLLYSSSSLWPPFASALISGLAASTALTILVVPALYVLLFRPSGEGKRKWPTRGVTVLLALVAFFGAGDRAEAESSITLQEVIELSAAAPSVEAARAGSKAANQSASATFRSAFFPSLFVDGEVLRRSDEITSSFSLGPLGTQDMVQLPEWEGTVAAGLRQKLVDPRVQFGGLQAARSAAEAESYTALRAAETAQLTSLDAALSVAEVQAAHSAAAAAGDSLSAQYDRVRLLAEAGRALNSDLLRLEVAVLELERDLSALGRRIEIAKLNLGRSLGLREPRTPQVPALPVDRLVEAADAVQPALGDRADVLSLEANKRRLRLESRSLLADGAPSVNLDIQSVTVLNQDVDPGTWFEAVLTLSWIPIASGVRDARRTELQASMEEVDARQEELLLGASLAVLQARADFETAVEDIAVQEVALANQAVLREEVVLQYEAGRVPITDLLDAEADVRRARTALETAQIRALRALFRLQHHSGRPIEVPGR